MSNDAMILLVTVGGLLVQIAISIAILAWFSWSLRDPPSTAPGGVIAGTTEWTKEGIPLPAPPAEAKETPNV